MNIFYIDKNPKTIAYQLVDKHIVKMPVESAQMLSTCKRLHDAKQTTFSFNGKQKTFWLFEDEKIVIDKVTNTLSVENNKCYAVTHFNHPSTIWSRANKSNYVWHIQLLKCMLDEYKSRYGRIHEVEKYVQFLEQVPSSIPDGVFYDPPLAMPTQYMVDDHVQSYRNFYVGEKWKFAKWKHGKIPPWFFPTMKSVWIKHSKVDQISTLGVKFNRFDTSIALYAAALAMR